MADKPVLREEAIKRRWFTSGAYKTVSYQQFRARIIDEWVKSWFVPQQAKNKLGGLDYDT